jgi:hypothetical protein
MPVDPRLAIEIGTIIFFAGGVYVMLNIMKKEVSKLRDKVDNLEDNKVDKRECTPVTKEMRDDIKELIKVVFRIEGKIDKNNGHS